MKAQAFKVKTNQILDERSMAALGRVPTFEERRDWWVRKDRYLAMFDDDPRQLEILQDAHDYRGR